MNNKIFEHVSGNQFKYTNPTPLKEYLDNDIKHLREVLIQEGLWDTIKQKVGDAIDNVGSKAKEVLLKPLVQTIMNRIAQDDPEGFAKLQQYAQAGKIEDLVKHPEIQKQAKKAEGELATTKESLAEQETDDLINEYINALLETVGIDTKHPLNEARIQRYNERKAYRLLTEEDKKDDEELSAAEMYKQGKWKKSKPSQKNQGIGGLPGAVDKAGIWGIEKGGDALKWIGDKAKQGMDSKAGQVAKNAVGGLISKVYAWAKDHPKITATVGIGLIVAVLGAAAVGSGGIGALIMGTLLAGGGGAIKGGAIGYGTGALKNMYNQIKGGADSFTKMDYKDVNKSGIKGAKTGAKWGAAIGAGTHVAGQALAGLGKMFGAKAAAAGQTANIGSELAKKANQDANKIVKLLSDPSASNQNLGFDYQMTKDLNLGDVLRANNPSGTGPDTDTILRIAQKYIEQGNPEEAAKYLSSKIANGLGALDKAGELAKHGLSAAADVAGQAKVGAASAAAEAFKPVSGQEVDQVWNAIVNGGVKDLNIHGHSFADILKGYSPTDYKTLWTSLKMQVQTGLDNPQLASSALESLKGILNGGLQNLAAN